MWFFELLSFYDVEKGKKIEIFIFISKNIVNDG